MKNVLLSIKPQFVEKILNGEKTIEIRKTKPNIETPFKCYIYCTKAKSLDNIVTIAEYENNEYMGDYIANGSVVAEFICNRIDVFYVYEHGSILNYNFLKLRNSCVLYEDIANYIGKEKIGYAWHISDLVIYDKPKELSEFYKYCGDYPTDCDKCNYGDINSNECVGDDSYCMSPVEMHKPLSRPPQSWGYVEELKI